MKNLYKHGHGGHRQRLKDKVREHGLKVLQQHEILELLLTYTIPRKDTNELAHNLLNTFGNLANVINASNKDLQTIKGVGEETALFFNVLSSFYDTYLQTKNKRSNTILNTSSKCIEYFRNNFEIKKREYLYIVCLSKGYNVVKTLQFEGENDCNILFDFKKFSTYINTEDVYGVVLFHTHPNGEAKPSAQDLATTQDLFGACCTLKIQMVDHIIFNETEQYSFGIAGKIAEYEDLYRNILRNNYRSFDNSKGRFRHE
ncbi:MAG: RadC family protein [Clostridia bacterium]|nr:RadC family protein [Clostridia bacterium]